MAITDYTKSFHWKYFEEMISHCGLMDSLTSGDSTERLGQLGQQNTWLMLEANQNGQLASRRHIGNDSVGLDVLL